MNIESITTKGYRIFAATLLTQKQKGPVSAASKHPQNPVFEISIFFFIQFFVNPIQRVGKQPDLYVPKYTPDCRYQTQDTAKSEVTSPCDRGAEPFPNDCSHKYTSLQIN